MEFWDLLNGQRFDGRDGLGLPIVREMNGQRVPLDFRVPVRPPDYEARRNRDAWMDQIYEDEWGFAPQQPGAVEQAIAGVGRLPGLLAQGVWDGISPPADALRGERQTNGAAFGTALDALGGGAAGAIPEGALGANSFRAYHGSPAQDVAGLLSAGRASDVTDDMMARADPQEMWDLYASGATGMDLPMDAASRAARATEQGFQPHTFYHSTPFDFDGFDLRASGVNTTVGDAERAVFTSASPQGSNSFIDRGWAADFQPFDGLENLDQARDRFMEIQRSQGEAAADAFWEDVRAHAPTVRAYAPGGRTMPVRVRTPDGFTTVDYNGNAYDPDEAVQEILDAKGEGQSGVLWRNIRDGGFYGGSQQQHVYVAFNPSHLRSTFARFDPRLSHLRNLNAGLAGATAAGAGAAANAYATPAEMSELEAYLAQF